MIRRPQTDFWKAGLLPAPIGRLLDPTALPRLRDEIVWLPDAGPWRYLADPFGIQRGATTHVFVEAFDYHTKHAVIEHHELGPDRKWRAPAVVLSSAVHLSYPYLVEDSGEVFMVPESHRANEVVLYRAKQFPDRWERETTLLKLPVAEPSLIRHRGRWWMFYTVVGPQKRDQRELHAAYADSLTGYWQPHADNPILVDRKGARPGGSPFVGPDGQVVLPVQDCTESYGGALRFVRFEILDPKMIQIAPVGPRLTGDLVSTSHTEGLHTLSACGGSTLIDVKRIDRSWSRLALDWRRRWRRFWGRRT